MRQKKYAYEGPQHLLHGLSYIWENVKNGCYKAYSYIESVYLEEKEKKLAIEKSLEVSREKKLLLTPEQRDYLSPKEIREYYEFIGIFDKDNLIISESVSNLIKLRNLNVWYPESPYLNPPKPWSEFVDKEWPLEQYAYEGYLDFITIEEALSNSWLKGYKHVGPGDKFINNKGKKCRLGIGLSAEIKNNIYHEEDKEAVISWRKKEKVCKDFLSYSLMMPVKLFEITYPFVKKPTFEILGYIWKNVKNDCYIHYHYIKYTWLIDPIKEEKRKLEMEEKRKMSMKPKNLNRNTRKDIENQRYKIEFFENIKRNNPHSYHSIIHQEKEKTKQLFEQILKMSREGKLFLTSGQRDSMDYESAVKYYKSIGIFDKDNQVISESISKLQKYIDLDPTKPWSEFVDKEWPLEIYWDEPEKKFYNIEEIVAHSAFENYTHIGPGDKFLNPKGKKCRLGVGFGPKAKKKMYYEENKITEDRKEFVCERMKDLIMFFLCFPVTVPALIVGLPIVIIKGINLTLNIINFKLLDTFGTPYIRDCAAWYYGENQYAPDPNYFSLEKVRTITKDNSLCSEHFDLFDLFENLDITKVKTQQQADLYFVKKYLGDYNRVGKIINYSWLFVTALTALHPLFIIHTGITAYLKYKRFFPDTSNLETEILNKTGFNVSPAAKRYIVFEDPLPTENTLNNNPHYQLGQNTLYNTSVSHYKYPGTIYEEGIGTIIDIVIGAHVSLGLFMAYVATFAVVLR